MRYQAYGTCSVRLTAMEEGLGLHNVRAGGVGWGRVRRRAEKRKKSRAKWRSGVQVQNEIGDQNNNKPQQRFKVSIPQSLAP